MSPRTILFASVREEPTLVALEGAPLPTTTVNHERIPFLLQLTSAALMNADNHSGYSRTSSPADRPDPAAATGTCLSLVSLWCGQLARVHWSGKVQEILLTTFISLLFSTPPILSYFFFLPPGPGHRNLVKDPQPELRIWDWSPPLDRKLEFWFWLGQIPVLLWRPGKSPVHLGICKWQETSVRPPLFFSFSSTLLDLFSPLSFSFNLASFPLFEDPRYLFTLSVNTWVWSSGSL